MEREEVMRRLADFTADCNGPLGPVPVTRAMRKHRAIFADLREAGLTWPAIADLLKEAGMAKSAKTWRQLFERASKEGDE